jgi:homopolymeric O-antigen transport system ATP-binding protein
LPNSITVDNVGKRYYRRNSHRPTSFHEALLKGMRRAKSEAFWGLRHVTFEVRPGTMLGVIGSNGAGKSTLLRLLADIDKPDEGSLRTHGRLDALLSLSAGFHPDLTGRENVFVSGVVHGLTRAEVRRRFDSIIAFAELEDFVDSPLRIYSTGMAMRLGFAVTAHMDSDILLIDEVLAVGDAAFEKKCLDRIRRLRTAGCTIVFISHDLGLIRQMCDQVIWLHRGEIAASGPSDDVVGQYLKGPPPAVAASHADSSLSVEA